MCVINLHCVSTKKYKNQKFILIVAFLIYISNVPFNNNTNKMKTFYLFLSMIFYFVQVNRNNIKFIIRYLLIEYTKLYLLFC